MSLGPVMVDIQGTTLTAEDRELLCHPKVGGMILFSRNYHSPEQLQALLVEVHALRSPRLLVAVDHEGGRVQRFRKGFTCLPAVARLGEIYDFDPSRALHLAELSGWLMAAELRSVGVDFSFAPVLDLGRGVSTVIGDRAFHATPQGVARLARAYVTGMQRAGMAATGKHFPGHGAVVADSHLALPVDNRSLDEIVTEDLYPFRTLIAHGLSGIMPAHVVYSRVDTAPAGFSRFWLQEILRDQLGFQGIIFSDDLSMAGAEGVGGYGARAYAALEAGCDMVLVCNCREGALEVLRALESHDQPFTHLSLVQMYGREGIYPDFPDRDKAWRDAVAELSHAFGDLALFPLS
ncbi:beta-N-acetylhexosaminidase [Gammaproteobacteria bacterium]